VVLTRALVRFVAPEVLTDPATAASRRPVFELLTGKPPTPTWLDLTA
jgi:hypothetical protein